MQMKFSKHYDVIIVGAGASGLSCALQLIENGVKVLVLEARDHVGGRARSWPHQQHGPPIELGAEFIHGAPASVLAILQDLQIPFYDVNDTHHFLRNSKLKEIPDFWDELSKLMQKIPAQVKNRDLSVMEFLESQKASAKQKALFQSFVEGFHSADLNLMSADGLYQSEEATSEDDLNGKELFRLQNGYSDFFESVLEAHPLLRKRILLQTKLQQIDLRSDRIGLHCQRGPENQKFSFTCQKVVLTLPLSLLKASIDFRSESALRWIPESPKKLSKILENVEMGDVQKLILSFKTRFWEANFKDKTPSFWHTGPEEYFPTWWTTSPVRSSQLIAWQGGPKATEMSRWTDFQKVTTALKTLSKLLNRSEDFLSDQLQAFYHHDWTRDPFSKGAYSYIRYGGVETSKKLSQVFEDRIFIAGEATVAGAARGTVHGAWQSGLRASRQILQRLSARSQSTQGRIETTHSMHARSGWRGG